ncbi:hypothetical protein [Corynebacterium matruchotii]|uniref:hypothetical protein n=1 Tax=Corynebacterium matruchotii TaxID=43768 RepID=UPI0028D02455|nr:hypothetical protein [Corynebacterium matruchotii]
MDDASNNETSTETPNKNIAFAEFDAMKDALSALRATYVHRNIADGSSAADKWWTAKFIAAGQLLKTADDSNPEERLRLCGWLMRKSS